MKYQVHHTALHHCQLEQEFVHARPLLHRFAAEALHDPLKIIRTSSETTFLFSAQDTSRHENTRMLMSPPLKSRSLVPMLFLGSKTTCSEGM
jgi:hypothetical protein